MQEEINRSDFRIRVVEKVGRSIKSVIQRSDPFKNKDCGALDSLVCRTGGKGSCRRMEINYDIACQECGENGEIIRYIGESAGNAYTRGLRHISELDGKRKESKMWRHCKDVHDGRIVDFKINVLSTHRQDAMHRQITESVRINWEEGLINNKTEWNYVKFPQVVVSTE